MGRAARHDILAIGLVRDATTLGSLAFGRHVLAGEIEDLEVVAARLLIPHLCRAVAISKLLDAKSVVAAFETALDTLDVAVILTTADMRIVHANTAAKEMLRSRDPIRSEHGRLSLRSTTAAAALAMAVRQAADDEAGIGKRGFGIPAPGPMVRPACCTSCR